MAHRRNWFYGRGDVHALQKQHVFLYALGTERFYQVLRDTDVGHLESVSGTDVQLQFIMAVQSGLLGDLAVQGGLLGDVLFPLGEVEMGVFLVVEGDSVHPSSWLDMVIGHRLGRHAH